MLLYCKLIRDYFEVKRLYKIQPDDPPEKAIRFLSCLITKSVHKLPGVDRYATI